MAFVLDCSVTMSWLFADESHEGAEALREALPDDPAVAPALWPVEVANVLLVATRRGRISASDWPVVAQHLESIAVEIDPSTLQAALAKALPLADRHGLTVYDAMYLELATRRGLPLATLDRQLAEASRNAGVRLRL